MRIVQRHKASIDFAARKGEAMNQLGLQQERRKHWRYPCAGEAWVRREGDNVSLQGVLSDISLGGCYVDMMHPLPSEARIELTFTLDGRRVRAKGRVCASREGFGMGVSFTEVQREDQPILQEVVDWLAGALPQGSVQNAKHSVSASEEDSVAPEAVPTPSESDTAGALDALLKLLECKGLVSAEECEELAQKMGRQASGRLTQEETSALRPRLCVGG
jgi:hypothetical protein